MAFRSFLIYSIVSLLLSCVNFCQTALTGLPETVVQIDTGLVHGTADHIIADVSGAGEEKA